MANLAAVLAHHSTNFVTNLFRATFWNHFASGVIAHLGSIFTYHPADFVRNFLCAAFRNHSAYGVGAGFCTALRHHFADTIGTRPGFTFGNYSANRIGYLPRTALTTITCAGDFFLFAGRNPDFLANCPRWALNAFGSTFSGCVHALAGTRIK